MRHITTLGPRDVIHCPTVQQYMDIRTLMLTSGAARIPKPEDWTDSAHNTCLLPNGTVSYLDYCQRKNLNIIPASELLVVAEPDWDYEDRMECLNDNNLLVDYIGLAIVTCFVWFMDSCRSIKRFFTPRPNTNL